MTGLPVIAGAPPAGRWRRVRALYARARQHVESDRLPDLLARMTILALLLHVHDHHYLVPSLGALALAGLVFTSLPRSAVYWGAVTGLLGLFFAYVWFSIDNHKYLIAYWCLALLGSRLVADPRPVLELNGRLLIGLGFGFATLWKLISPEFLDGTFFHMTFLTDQRFQTFARVVGEVPLDALRQNHKDLDMLVRGFGQVSHLPDPLPLRDSVVLPSLARALAVWTVALEGLTAVTFLWPRADRVRLARHAVLVVFILTTYPVATVAGFAMLLAVMAAGQCERDRPALALGYVLLFVLVPLFSFPYGAVLGRVFGH